MGGGDGGGRGGGGGTPARHNSGEADRGGQIDRRTIFPVSSRLSELQTAAVMMSEASPPPLTPADMHG